MQPNKNTKKVLSFSTDMQDVLDQIAALSEETGTTQSRILGYCAMIGYVLLYSKPSEANNILQILQKRHGRLLDVEWVQTLTQKK